MAVIGVVCSEKLVEALQAGEAHSGAHFRHLAVSANIHDIVVGGEPEIPQGADLGRQFIILGNDSSAFKGIEELGGVETEHLKFSEAADHAPLVRARKCVSCIKHQRQAMRFRNAVKFLDFAWTAP